MDLITIVIWMLVGAAIAWAIEWFFWDRPTRAALTRQFEEELTASRNETEKLRVDLRDSRDRSAQLEREVGDVRAVLKAEADVRATAESKLLASDKKSVDLTAELARTRSELQTATTRAAIIPTLEQSVNEWDQKHRAEAEARAAADEKGLALSAELEAVRAELARATQQAALVPNLQASALDWEARYRQELSSREQAEVKTGEVHLLLDRSRAQIGDWEARFKAEANARAAAEARAGSLNLELDQLRSQTDALLKQQQDAFSAADQQAGGLSTEIDKLRAQLEAQLSQFEAETAARRQAEARAESLDVELETTRGELTTVHERVAVIPTLQASATDWESKYTAEVANRTRYQQEIQNYETELAQRGDRLNALDAQHRQALSAQAAAEQRVAELSTQMEALQLQLSEGQASAETSQKTRVELEQEREALRAQMGALEEKVSSEATSRASLEQRLLALEHERDELRAKIEASESQLASEATARIAADQQADTLRSELDKLRLEVGGLHNRVTMIPTLENNVSSWEQRYQSEAQLRTQLDGAVRERDTEISTLRERIATLEAEHSTRTATLRSQLELFGTPTRADNLEDINGIGKVFARKLNAAGVMTFEDLARMPVERIREIIQPKTWQKIEPEAWVVEAATLAGGTIQAPSSPVRVDNLEDINGIGVVFAARLNAAGIVNFEQLAATSPVRIKEILNPEEWQKIEPEAWVSEAAEFARRGQ